MNRIAIIVIRTFLGLLFLAAGIPKVGAHLPTLAAVYSYQIVLPDWLATAIAYGLPWVEIGLGLALISGLVMPLTLAATAIVLLFFSGFLQLSFASMAQTLVQMEAPAHMRGRVIGLYAMSSQGLRAFAGVTVGLLGSLIGIHWSLALSALMLLTVVAILMAFTVRTK